MRIVNNDTIVEATPELIAEMFCRLDSAEQARFFNHIDSVASIWDGNLCFQMQYITDEQGLTLAGRRVMQMIGEYSHWGILKQKEVSCERVD